MAATVLEKFLSDNEMLTESPKECDLKIGDKVTFTNEYGVYFEELLVIGFAKPENELNGRFIHLSSDCAWFPVKREELTKAGEPINGKFRGCVHHTIMKVKYPNGFSRTYNTAKQKKLAA